MGGEQAAKTMSEVFRAGAARKGRDVDEAMLAEQEARVIAHYDRQSGAFYTSGRMLDDGLIDPRDSRRVLAMALAICREAAARRLQPNAFGVARHVIRRADRGDLRHATERGKPAAGRWR
jgi:geranyl-CoA carboxylase beta subunit